MDDELKQRVKDGLFATIEERQRKLRQQLLEDAKGWLLRTYGAERWADLPHDKYNEAVTAFEEWCARVRTYPNAARI